MQGRTGHEDLRKRDFWNIGRNGSKEDRNR